MGARKENTLKSKTVNADKANTFGVVAVKVGKDFRFGGKVASNDVNYEIAA